MSIREERRTILNKILPEEDYKKVIMITPTLGGFHTMYTFIVLTSVLYEKMGYVLMQIVAFILHLATWVIVN
jgi:hypothetical protein